MHQSPDILASFGDWETRMERALASVRAGRGVLVVDDEDRENEGDLIYPAHSLTDAQMARLIRHCSGIVCLCLTDERATRLGLPPMVAHNTNTQQTAFTISIEAAEGVTTGVSAADRVTTVKAAVAEKAIPACNIVCLLGDEMKTAASGYLQVLFDQNPESVGGKLPGDDFYWMGN